MARIDDKLAWNWFRDLFPNSDSKTDATHRMNIEDKVNYELEEAFDLETYNTIEMLEPGVETDPEEDLSLYVLDPAASYSEEDFREVAGLLESHDVLARDEQYKGVAYFATRMGHDFKGPRDIEASFGNIGGIRDKYDLISLPKTDYSK